MPTRAPGPPIADYGSLAEFLLGPARAYAARPPQTQSLGLLGDIHNAIDPVQAFGGYGGLLAMATPFGAETPRPAPPMLPESIQIARAKNMGAAKPEEVWYHGSPTDLYKTPERGFRPLEGETGVKASWGSSNPFVAEEYSRGEMALTPDNTGKFPLTKSYYKDYDGGGGVYSLRSLAKNPKIINAGDKNWVDVPRQKILEDAKANGHDAVIFRGMADNLHSDFPPSDIIAWLDPSKIRALGARFKKHGTDLLGSVALGYVALNGKDK